MYYKIKSETLVNEKGNIINQYVEYLTKPSYISEIENLIKEEYNYNGKAHLWKKELENDKYETIYFAEYIV